MDNTNSLVVVEESQKSTSKTAKNEKKKAERAAKVEAGIARAAAKNGTPAVSETSRVVEVPLPPDTSDGAMMRFCRAFLAANPFLTSEQQYRQASLRWHKHLKKATKRPLDCHWSVFLGGDGR